MGTASRSSAPPSFAFVPRAARVAVSLTVVYRGRRAEPLLDTTEDLSLTGVFVHSDEPHTVGTEVVLALALPDGPLEVEGRVVRVGVGRSGRVGMGIFFTRLAPAAKARLQAVIDAALQRR